MKQINTIIVGLFLAVWCTTWVGCTQEEVDVAQEIEEGTPVSVKLNLSTSPLVGDPVTRATASYTADVENLIHDIRILQYNSMGILRSNELCFHNDDGITQVNNVSANLLAATNATLVVLVNMEECDFSYPDLLTTLKSTKYPFTYDATTTRLPMTGHYTGDITANQSLNITLGRLAVRVNLVIADSCGGNFVDLGVKLYHIPRCTYLYTGEENPEELSDEDYAESPSTLYFDEGGSIASGSNAYCYYYMLPNYCNSETNAPKVAITGTLVTTVEEVETRTPLAYSYILGEDAAGYTLYPNSIYNVTLTLTK